MCTIDDITANVTKYEDWSIGPDGKPLEFKDEVDDPSPEADSYLCEEHEEELETLDAVKRHLEKNKS